MENMNLKGKIIDFLSVLEGYHETCKMLHWASTIHNEHELLDTIDKKVLEIEDRFAEASMGKLNTRFGLGDIKAMLPNAKTPTEMLKELESDTIDMKKTIGDGIEMSGLQNILDDLLESINTYQYLITFAK